MFGLDETFLALRSTLRSVTICSLLIFAHVILVTMAVAPRELFEAYPELSRAVKLLSGMTFLTLLWKVFILFELADLAPAPYAARAEAVDEKAGLEVEADIVDDDAKAAEGGHVYTRTGSEVVMGTLALAGWAYCVPSAMTIFQILSARLVKELVLLPISYGLAVSSLAISQILLLAQLYRLRHTRAAGTKLWTARTGHWDVRVKLGRERAGEMA